MQSVIFLYKFFVLYACGPQILFCFICMWSQRLIMEWYPLCFADPDSKYFTLRMHHDGEFRDNPHREYVGGRVDVFHHRHPDLMSLLELDEMARGLGYDEEILRYHYLIPGKNLDNGLILLYTDNQVFTTFNSLYPNTVADVYIEHRSLFDVFDEEGVRNDVDTKIRHSD